MVKKGPVINDKNIIRFVTGRSPTKRLQLHCLDKGENTHVRAPTLLRAVARQVFDELLIYQLHRA